MTHLFLISPRLGRCSAAFLCADSNLLPFGSKLNETMRPADILVHTRILYLFIFLMSTPVGVGQAQQSVSSEDWNSLITIMAAVFPRLLME